MINSLSIKSKISIALIVPLFALFVLLTVHSIDIALDINAFKNLQNNLSMIEKISNVIHHTQVERGVSSRYIASAGEKNKDFILRVQKNTDTAIMRLSSILILNKQDKNFLNIFSTLKEQRKKIIGLEIDTKENIGYYTYIIKRLLQEIEIQPSKAQGITDRNLLEAYIHLIQSKEALAHIRAYLTIAFSKNKFENLNYSKFSYAWWSYNDHKEKYLFMVGANIKKMFIKHYNEELCKDTNEMIDDALRYGLAGTLNVNPEYWFEKISKRIDALYFVEQDFLGEVKKNAIKEIEELNFEMYATFALLIVLSLVMLSMVYFVIRDIITTLNNFKTQQLQEANANLQVKVDEELEKNQKQYNLMQHQARLAALGEMMGNIAHQWRQPLSAITVRASSLLIDEELATPKDAEHYKDSLRGIMKNAEFLSQTIEDFRNFVKNERISKEFIMNDLIYEVYDIIKANFVANNITIYFYMEEQITYLGYPNELKQVILNILNNAKDVLSEKNIEPSLVLVYLKNEEDGIKIEIVDNGRGIPEEILDKIFDPYFTTKHQSQGTGIGLYMSSQIIKDIFKGKLFAFNTIFEFKNTIYSGACLSILLPSIKDEQN